MQVPFPVFNTPDTGVPLPYPIQLTRPYDPATAVVFQTQKSDRNKKMVRMEGGAWYNNWDDFKRQFTDPNSGLRSGRFFNTVQGIVDPLTMFAERIGERRGMPDVNRYAQAIRQGLGTFRRFTGLGKPRGHYLGGYMGGASPKSKRLRGEAAGPALVGKTSARKAAKLMEAMAMAAANEDVGPMPTRPAPPPPKQRRSAGVGPSLRSRPQMQAAMDAAASALAPQLRGAPSASRSALSQSRALSGELGPLPQSPFASRTSSGLRHSARSATRAAVLARSPTTLNQAIEQFQLQHTVGRQADVARATQALTEATLAESARQSMRPYESLRSTGVVAAAQRAALAQSLTRSQPLPDPLLQQMPYQSLMPRSSTRPRADDLAQAVTFQDEINDVESAVDRAPADAFFPVLGEARRPTYAGPTYIPPDAMIPTGVLPGISTGFLPPQIPSAPQYSAPVIMSSPSAMFSSARSGTTTVSERSRTPQTAPRTARSGMSAASRLSDWTSSTARSALRRAKGMVLRHTGYLPSGIPDLPRMMARKASGKAPSAKQLAARAKFAAPGGPMDRWQEFRQMHPGVGPKELSALWHASGLSTRENPPLPRRASHAGEALRYARLVDAAKKQKVPFVWHSSRTGPGAYSRHSHSRLSDLTFLGRPYGEQFMHEGALHGSGRVYG